MGVFLKKKTCEYIFKNWIWFTADVQLQRNVRILRFWKYLTLFNYGKATVHLYLCSRWTNYHDANIGVARWVQGGHAPLISSIFWHFVLCEAVSCTKYCCSFKSQKTWPQKIFRAGYVTGYGLSTKFALCSGTSKNSPFLVHWIYNNVAENLLHFSSWHWCPKAIVRQDRNWVMNAYLYTLQECQPAQRLIVNA